MRILVGQGPRGIAINAADTRADVANENSRDLSVIDVVTKQNGTTAAGALGYNPPSLFGAFALAPYLHNGSAFTLQEVMPRNDLKTHRVAGLAAADPDPFNDAANVADMVTFLSSIDTTTNQFDITPLPPAASLRAKNLSANSRGRRGGRFERMAALQILAIPLGIAVVCALPCAQTASPASARLFADKFQATLKKSPRMRAPRGTFSALPQGAVGVAQLPRQTQRRE